MRYLRVLWHHDFPDDPVELYSECDDNGWELRKVDVFADGTMTFASEQESTGTTALGEVPVPPLAEIGLNPEFEPMAISKEEFEKVWEKAHQAHPRRPLRKAQ
jgi:hypothetical protein